MAVGGLSGALPVYGNASAGSKIFNPDMAVISNLLGVAGKNGVNPLPALALPESELSLQAIVDPYARADFFLSFGEEGVAVEEGYLTFPTLPGGLLMKVGRQYAAFGKANTLHSHILPWADRPLVSTNLVGGDEPMADAGISVERLIPNPWLFLEATGQVFRGDGGVFHSSERSDLSYVGHVRGIRTSASPPTSISVRPTPTVTTARASSIRVGSRRHCSAWTQRYGGGLYSAPFISHSWAAAKRSGVGAVSHSRTTRMRRASISRATTSLDVGGLAACASTDPREPKTVEPWIQDSPWS